MYSISLAKEKFAKRRMETLLDSNKFNVYKVIIFILFVNSMYPWLTLQINTLFVSLFGFIFTFTFSFLNKNAFKKPSMSIISLLLILYLWVAAHSTFFGLINQIFNFYIIKTIISLRLIYQIELFKSITKWFSILLLVSMVFFILFYIGIPLTHTSLYFPELNYTFENYYFFVYDSSELLPRFRSIFGEPGHLTQGLILLLVANQFNVKNRYVFILLLAQLLTFSLAGYICMIVSYTMYTVFSDIKIKKLIIPSLILVVIIYYLLNMSQDTFFYEIIGYRFDMDLASGRNERVGYETQKIFESFLNSSKVLWGLDSSTLAKIDGSGYKVYMMSYGIVGLLLTILFYWRYALSAKCKYCFVIFVVWALEQYQGAASLWFCVLIGFILGVNNIQYENSHELQQ